MSYQQEELPPDHPSKKKFLGWKIGTNLTDAQADLLEPVVDVMIQMLQEVLLLPPKWDRAKSQHELALTLIEATGVAAGMINDISMMMVTENNPNEKLAQLNYKASQLRKVWLYVSVIAAKAVINLDHTLKEDEPNGTDNSK